MIFDVRCKNQEGFTLIELLVAIFGFGLIIWGLIGLLSNILVTGNQQSTLTSDADYGRKLVAQIVSEFRNAQVGANGAYNLDTAGDQQLIFYSNSDQDPAVERIRYYVQNGQLWKGVTEYNGATYNTSTEKSIIVQKDLANGNNPLFYYYDGSFVASSSQASLTQPVNVTAVKFIKVVLQILNKVSVSGTTYSIIGGGAIRNLKTNLAQ